MTPVLTASAMSGKFFSPRARATILFALLGVRRVVEVSHPAGPGKPSFSRLDAGVDVGDEGDPPGFQQLDLVGDISSVGEEFAFAQLPDLRGHGDKCIERVFDAQ